MSTEGEPHIGHYELPNNIGQETFAKERLAWHILTRTEVAVSH